jgi:hypothetical protein
VPVKGEQMNAYLFSDTTKINKNKKWKEDESIAKVSTGDIRPSGRGERERLRRKRPAEEMSFQLFVEDRWR